LRIKEQKTRLTLHELDDDDDDDTKSLNTAFATTLLETGQTTDSEHILEQVNTTPM
jgi:hypothetical protein